MEDKELEVAYNYFNQKGWKPFDFQIEAWKDFLAGKSGILNAPTGSGKTFALWFPPILDYIRKHPQNWQKPQKMGIQVIWITPLRALAQDIHQARKFVMLLDYHGK